MIITLDEISDVQKAIDTKLIDTSKYVCIIARDNTVLIKPNVTTKGRETFVLIKLTKKEVDYLSELFSNVLEANSITFREDNFQM